MSKGVGECCEAAAAAGCEKDNTMYFCPTDFVREKAVTAPTLFRRPFLAALMYRCRHRRSHHSHFSAEIFFFFFLNDWKRDLSLRGFLSAVRLLGMWELTDVIWCESVTQASDLICKIISKIARRRQAGVEQTRTPFLELFTSRCDSVFCRGGRNICDYKHEAADKWWDYCCALQHGLVHCFVFLFCPFYQHNCLSPRYRGFSNLIFKGLNLISRQSQRSRTTADERNHFIQSACNLLPKETATVCLQLFALLTWATPTETLTFTWLTFHASTNGVPLSLHKNKHKKVPQNTTSKWLR